MSHLGNLSQGDNYKNLLCETVRIIIIANKEWAPTSPVMYFYLRGTIAFPTNDEGRKKVSHVLFEF